MPADQTLRAKRKSRESVVEIGKFKFTILRPNTYEAIDLQSRREDYRTTALWLADVAKDYVVGWEGVTEADIVSNGVSDAIPFNRDIWADWVYDRADFWGPLGNGILDAYQKYSDKLEASEKN